MTKECDLIQNLDLSILYEIQYEQHESMQRNPMCASVSPPSFFSPYDAPYCGWNYRQNITIESVNSNTDNLSLYIVTSEISIKPISPRATFLFILLYLAVKLGLRRKRFGKSAVWFSKRVERLSSRRGLLSSPQSRGGRLWRRFIASRCRVPMI